MAKKTKKNKKSKVETTNKSNSVVFNTENSQIIEKDLGLKQEKTPAKKNTQSGTKKSESRKPVIEDLGYKLFLTFWVFVGIALVISGGFIGIPYLYDLTKESQVVKSAEEIKDEKDEAPKTEQQVSKDLEETIKKEDEVLKFTNQTVVLETNYGPIEIKLYDKAAPKTVENFIRLVYRNYYNGTAFHRIVKSDGFSVIQGGDPKGDGTGGQSAFGSNLIDEVWKVQPQYRQNEQDKVSLTNTPEFYDSSLYKDYDSATNLSTLRKGLIAMANTGQANSAGSQFFIMLKDTRLPTQYTVFGEVSESSLAVLDKIYNDIEPVNQEGKPADRGDGKPNKELVIEKAKIK